MELEHIFPGPGEMARLMRAQDWSATPFGPVSTWPESLKTAVGICLSSRFPIVMWWGPDLLLLYNDAWRPVLGRTKHPAIAKPGRQVWPEIWHIIGPMLEGVLRTGQATWQDDQLLMLDRNGYLEEAYFTYSYSPIYLADGTVGGAFSAVNETTSRVLSERRLHTLRELGAQASLAKTAHEACRMSVDTLMENQADVPFALLYLLTGDGTRLVLHGASPSTAMVPAPPTVPVVSERAADTWRLGDVVHTGKSLRLDGLHARVGELPRGPWPVESDTAVVLPLNAPGQERVAGVLVVGVNPCRALDEQYESFLTLLASHIATTISNAHAYEQERQRAEALAELDRAKTAFFSNVSHEFRTPLMLLLGPIEDLLYRSHVPLPPSINEPLDLVHRNALRLLRLVNALLDFSRIEAGRVQARFEPTDLAVFTIDLASLFRSATDRAGLELRVDCPPVGEPVFVDPEMWEKIVLNLLSNAFKFTFEGDIAVRLRRQGDAVELLVRDSGVGIPSDEMPRLFERFHRVQHTRSRTHEGSGIGLALVQELVQLHGGSVRAESALGTGSTFIVTIPLGSAHLPPDRIVEQSPSKPRLTGAAPFVEEALRWLPDEHADRQFIGQGAADPAGASASERACILIADDNADMRQYIGRVVAERFDVVTVGDGEAALATARLHRPALIVSDVMMPRLDGFGLLRALRADPMLRTIPVILVSARAGEESRVEGLEHGADDYLVKPFSARELLARVTAHVEMARVRHEAAEAVREKQEQLIQASKLASIGQLATGVAHELNNPLNNIGLFIGNVLDYVRAGEIDRRVFLRSLEQAQVQVRKAATIIEHLKTFGRLSPAARRTVALNHTLRAAVSLLEEQFRLHNIDLKMDLAPEEPQVLGNEIQLEQVFLNLLTNARDAVSDSETKCITIRTLCQSTTAEVRIQDTGPGIPPETQSRIFDPFFTTKEVGKGTGLGLSISYGIVRDHHGDIVVKSRLGDGALFIITLPLAEGSVKRVT